MVFAIIAGILSLGGTLYGLCSIFAALHRNGRTPLLWFIPLTVGSALLTLGNAALGWHAAHGPRWLPLPASLLSSFAALFLFGGLVRLARHRDPSSRRPRG